MSESIALYDGAQIAAILPCYTASGDGVTLLTKDNRCIETNVSIRTTIRRLARSQATDLTELKRHTARTTGQRILHVLPLAGSLVLFPVKVRVPRIAKDTAIGYINATAVARLEPLGEPPYKSVIILTSGRKVPCLWLTGTVEKYRRAARLLAVARTTPNAFYETAAKYPPDLLSISHKLIEVFYDILALKNRRNTD